MQGTRLSPNLMWAIIVVVFWVVAIAAIAIAPAFTTNTSTGMGAMLQKPFNDPSDISNSTQTFFISMAGAALMGLLLGGFLRWILKKEVKVAVRVIVSICIFLILSVTFVALATTLYGPDILRTPSSWLLLLPPLVLAGAQYIYPEYWVIDVVSILAAVGISALLGSSLGLVPTIILLTLFSIYDLIAVTATSWMKKMAQGSADLKLPSMFVLPYDLTTSYRHTDIGLDAGKKNFMILGTGDLVFPTVLAVSANIVLQNNIITGSIIFGISVAYTVMFLMLKHYPERFKLLPGLPFLCGGAVLSLICSSMAMGIKWL